jgi:hypothetical protein
MDPMEADELTDRVLRLGVLALAPIAVLVAATVGLREGAGVAAGGVLALGDFRWLARDAQRLVRGNREGGLRLAPIALRQLAAFGALAALIGSGIVHPLSVAAGLAVLPPVLIVEGLRAAKR